MPLPLRTIDLDHLPYAAAYEAQLHHLAQVQAARDSESPEIGRLLLVEHVPPVITISRRQGAADHLLASRDTLARMGIELHETDRGGDITYHGPGQLVAYPILDLNALGLSLHAYMRLLEQIVIDTVAAFDVQAHRDTCATGVWVGGDATGNGDCATELSVGRCSGGVQTDAPPDRQDNDPATGQSHGAHHRTGAKLCAMGVRVKRWVSMHGLALNVTTNLDHFNLIVPCGLANRPVTSLAKLLGPRCPTMQQVKHELVTRFESHTAQLAQRRADTLHTRPEQARAD